ncbi:MAG: FixH family protein [Acidobacteriota bacterium]
MTLKWNWGTGIALVYSTFALSTIGFVAFAMNRPVSLVSDDYYEQSLHEDARREAVANAAALGPRVALTRTDDQDLVVHLPAEQAGAAGSLTLYRASDSASDRRVPLALRPDGTQRVSLHGLQAGQWLAQLRWAANGHAYYTEQPLVVR